jgi:hypothetical protein
VECRICLLSADPPHFPKPFQGWAITRGPCSQTTQSTLPSSVSFPRPSTTCFRRLSSRSTATDIPCLKRGPGHVQKSNSQTHCSSQFREYLELKALVSSRIDALPLKKAKFGTLGATRMASYRSARHICCCCHCDVQSRTPETSILRPTLLSASMFLVRINRMISLGPRNSNWADRLVEGSS